MIVYSVSSLRAINPNQFKMISFQHVTPGSVWHQGGTFFSVKKVSAIYFQTFQHVFRKVPLSLHNQIIHEKITNHNLT